MAAPDYDRLIEDMLRAEPMKAAPKSLYAKVHARLIVNNLIEKERHWLRRYMAGIGLAATGVAGCAVVLYLFHRVFAPIIFRIPGVMGWCDYVANNFFSYVLTGAVVLGFVAAFPVLAAVVFYLIPRRHLAD